MSRRFVRKMTLLAVVLTTGVTFQFGSCAAALANLGLGAIDFCAVINSLSGRTDCVIGPFAPCGIPNIITVDEDGLPTSEVMFNEDDLLLDCPVTVIQEDGNN